MTRIVLASGSPRRRLALEMLGVDFVVRRPDVDETPHQGEHPEQYVARIARAKAAAVTGDATEWVVAADTTVVLDGRILGKPAGPSDASATLQSLAGRTHRVLTGLVLQGPRGLAERVIETTVTMREMSTADVDWYVATGEPLDKAGSYGIQGLGAVFVDHLDGDFYNVLGMPLAALAQMLGDAGVPVSAWMRASGRS